MRWLFPILLAFAVFSAAPDSPAVDFQMADGSVITGEMVAPNDDGTVIRRSSGGLTSRLGWDRFAQETLREMAKDPKLKEFVEAFIDLPEGAEDEMLPAITVHDPPGKVDRPARRPGFFAALATPAGWFLILVVLLANVYAAYEVSIFRNYPAAAVIGTSVILPVLGPLLFLFMPTRVQEDVQSEAMPEPPPEAANSGAQDLASAGLAGSALSLSAGKAAAAAAATTAQAASYKRSETEFNRAFFEKSFPLFFRMTRTDADKGSTLAIRSNKGEVVATRISRISGNEIGLVTQKGHEVQVRFADIVEVQLRPKAA